MQAPPHYCQLELSRPPALPPLAPSAVTANGTSVGAYRTVKMGGGSLVLQASLPLQ